MFRYGHTGESGSESDYCSEHSADPLEPCFCNCLTLFLANSNWLHVHAYVHVYINWEQERSADLGTRPAFHVYVFTCGQCTCSALSKVVGKCFHNWYNIHKHTDSTAAVLTRWGTLNKHCMLPTCDHWLNMCTCNAGLVPGSADLSCSNTYFW